MMIVDKAEANFYEKTNGYGKDNDWDESDDDLYDENGYERIEDNSDYEDDDYYEDEDDEYTSRCDECACRSCTQSVNCNMCECDECWQGDKVRPDCLDYKDH